MKKYRNGVIVFLTIAMLILTSLVSATTSKPGGATCTPDAIVEVSCDEPEIIIEKTVWNGTAWAEYAEVSLGDTVQFKGDVYNPNEYEIDFSGVIYDIFPDNLRYVNQSCTLLDFSPDVVEIVDWENNNVSWLRIPILPAGETFTFYYNATAVDCGLGTNNIYTQAYVMYSVENRIPVNDSDEATVYVECADEAEIIIEKTVWNGTAWAEYAEVSLGDTVQFKGDVYNPNEYEIDFSGVIYDRFPDNLRYINESSTLLGLTEHVFEVVDLENNTVYWYRVPIIPPGEVLTFTFNATAVDCGLGINNITADAYVMYSVEKQISINDIYTQAYVVHSVKERSPVNDSDEATVYVDCLSPPVANVSVEKYVKWNCTPPFKKYVDAEIGDFVVFKLFVNNTGDTLLDIVVDDELPDGLSYVLDSASPLPDDVSGNTLTWYFYSVEPGGSIVITFNANVTDYGTHVNTVNVSAFETCSHVWYYAQANAIVYVRSTSDTEPPIVEITKPKENWLYRNNIRIRPLLDKTKIIGYIRIKVKAEDASGIEKVEFYIDGQLEYTDTSSKYSWIWLPRSKEDHTIKVIAYDIAGNANSTELTVSIERGRPLLAIGAIGGFVLLINRLAKLRSEEEAEPPVEEPEEEPEEKPVEEPGEEPEAELEEEPEEEDYIFWYIIGGLSVILAMLLVGLFIGRKFYV
jgi:uncharacterized repeat protein (TIGR01451 family)